MWVAPRAQWRGCPVGCGISPRLVGGPRLRQGAGELVRPFSPLHPSSHSLPPPLTAPSHTLPAPSVGGLGGAQQWRHSYSWCKPHDSVEKQAVSITQRRTQTQEERRNNTCNGPQQLQFGLEQKPEQGCWRTYGCMHEHRRTHADTQESVMVLDMWCVLPSARL